MSINNEIQKLQTNLSNSYLKCSNKGADIPIKQNFDNLVNCIRSFTTVKVGIPREIINNVYQRPSNLFTFTFPSNIIDIGSYGLYYAFYNYTPLTSISFPALTTISGSYGLYSAFEGCTSLTSISFPALTTISSPRGLYTAFKGCTSLTSISFPALTELLGQYALFNTFSNCTSLVTVSFPVLSNISSTGALSKAFNEAFSGCTSLTSIYFNALTTTSFGTKKDQFDNMLTGCKNVTVHFPFDLESTMSSWSSVTNGFGGTNTTVLFDLGGCITTFVLTPSTGSTIVVNSVELTGTTVGLAKNSTANYEIYNSSYGLYASTYNVPDSDSSTVSIDITQNIYNTISLNVGVSNLNVIAIINNISYTMNEIGNSGIYSLNIYNNTGNNISVNYFIDGGDTYLDTTGTLTFNNSDISETITMQPATLYNFSRPNLSANGTLGGNNFAVKASTLSTAWRAVDSSTSTYAGLTSSYGYDFIFYNPNALKISKLVLRFTSTTYSITAVTLYGSDDNLTWTSINSWSGSKATSITFNTTSSKFYTYHKLEMTPSGSSIRLADVAITATYKEATS